MPGLDIRDPKLAVIHDRLFLYVLSNRGIVAEPSQSYVSSSENGEDWSQKQELEPKGWILWRPKTFDHKNWYVGAYWHEHGISILLKSQDGRRWEKVSEIHRGGFNDETDIEFLPDGRILSTIRIEGSGAPLGGVLGHSEGGTLLAVSEPPYQNWTHGLSKTTRLDGPNLFRLGETLYALGRYHCNAGAGWTNRMGSFLGRKRTSLYKVGLGELVHIADFPSCGDTGYPGVVVKEGAIYVCYYTNGLGRDYRWLHGLFLPSHVRLAKIPVSSIP
jgi:hypothetical protein